MCPSVIFLGSYPSADTHGPAVRRDVDEAGREADDWLGAIRALIGPDPA